MDTSNIETEIRIQPEGWVESIVITLGHHSCGRESDGYSIYVTKNRKWNNGGVLSRTDMQKLVNIFQERLTENPPTDTTD